MNYLKNKNFLINEVFDATTMFQFNLTKPIRYTHHHMKRKLGTIRYYYWSKKKIGTY
jgi:hypothetical protein